MNLKPILRRPTPFSPLNESGKMRPSDAFGVIIRSIGLLLILSALWVLFWAILNLVGGGPGNVLGMMISGIPMLFVGIWFLGGAPSLVSFAYRDNHKLADDQKKE